tara:strand:+ start:3947 stop:5191 length:1245 start_codon:yes stop_codon:yes gene_type:complete
VATKLKLVLDKLNEQAIYFQNLIPEIPDTETWEVEVKFKLADIVNNNGLFSTFTDNANNYMPYTLLKTNGTISEFTSAGNETSQGSGYDFSQVITLKMSHTANDGNNVTYDVNGSVSTEWSPFNTFPDFNYLFGFVRNKEGQASYYYGADFYYLKITSPNFNETWDADLIGSSGAVTTLPSLSGTRDATLPNSGTVVAYDDGTGNAKPIALLGADADINTGALFTADASGSSDLNDDPLTYITTLDTPAGSAATLADSTTVSPSFTPDIDGTYTLTLVVNDGTEDSDPDTQTLTATTPATSISNAGSDSVQYTGVSVTLNGSASVGSVFAWSILQSPSGSTATISSPANQSTSITLDTVGLYEFQLDVDGELDTVFVRARNTIQPQTPIASIALSGTQELNGVITLVANGVYNA